MVVEEVHPREGGLVDLEHVVHVLVVGDVTQRLAVGDLSQRVEGVEVHGLGNVEWLEDGARGKAFPVDELGPGCEGAVEPGLDVEGVAAGAFAVILNGSECRLVSGFVLFPGL